MDALASSKLKVSVGSAKLAFNSISTRLLSSLRALMVELRPTYPSKSSRNKPKKRFSIIKELIPKITKKVIATCRMNLNRTKEKKNILTILETFLEFYEI